MPIDDTKQFTIGIGNQRMKKWSVIYGSRLSNATDAQLHFLAEHFDLIDCNPYMTSQPYNAQKLATLKQYAQVDGNPNIKGIGYYYWFSSRTTTYPEDWYIHYAVPISSSNRAFETDAGNTSYILSPKLNLTSYQGYTSPAHLFTSKCYNNCVNYPQYDGVFDDNAFGSLAVINNNYSDTGMPHKPSAGWYDENGTRITEAMWQPWVQGAFTYQQSVLNTLPSHPDGTPKISMPNDGPDGLIVGSPTGWICYEHVFHSLRTSYLNYWGGTEGGTLFGVKQINETHAMQKNGINVGYLSGCAADAGYDGWLLYCYCSALLSCETLNQTYFAWNFFGDDSNNGWIAYPMDVNVGAPITPWGTATDIRNTSMLLYSHPDDPYGFPYHGGVFAREFENYWVVVNCAGAIQGQPVLPKYNYTWTDPDGGAHVIPGKRALLWEK